MKRWMVWASGIVLIIALVAYGNWPSPKPVRIVLADLGTVESTVANTRVGSVNACERSRLSPAIGGQIAQLYVDEGDRVVKDQLLLELWNEDRRANVRQAQAQLRVVEHERQRACIVADNDRREAQRSDSLMRQKLVSQESADQINSRADASAAACAGATVQLEQAQAAVGVAEALLEQTRLRAPFAGVIAEVTGEMGEFSTPSPPGVPTPPAIDLLTDDCYYVAVPIDEVDAAQVKEGMPVRVSFDAHRGSSFPGQVRRVAAYVLDYEKQARTVDVEISLAEEDQHNLIAGYSADAEILLAVREGVVRVPAGAVLEQAGGSFLWLADDDNRLQQRPVRVGISNWRYSEISEGLREGERVVLAQGRDDLAVGDWVRAETEQLR